MADRNPQQVTSAGLTATAHPASSGGDTVPPDVVLRVITTSTATTLTMVTHTTVDGDLAVADREVAVPSGASRYVRVSRTYVNPATGRVDLTWLATTGVTFEVIR